MDEFQKNEIRNYLTAGGLLLFCVTIGLALISVITGDVTATGLPALQMIGSGVLFLILGILLAVLRKRDLAAIAFLVTGAGTFGVAFTDITIAGETSILIVGAVYLASALLLLFAKDCKKIVFSLILAAFGLSVILSGLGVAVTIVLDLIAIVIALYFALAAGFEKISLPGRDLITADDSTEFKQSGSAVGYLIFAAVSGAWVVSYIFGAAGNISLSAGIAGSLPGIEKAFALVLAVVAILLFAVGKMRFTPVMFLFIAMAYYLVSVSTGFAMYVIGGLFILLGLFAMVRNESRILPGLMLIIYGCTDFFSVIAGATTNPVLSIFLNAIPCLIAVYLAVATFSQKKLPLI